LSEFKWYIITTAAGCENKAANLIKEMANKKNLSHYIEEVIVPVEKVTQSRKGKDVLVEKKILPGYIMIKMDLQDNIWNLIKNTQHVSKFLGSGAKPSPVSQKEIDLTLNKIEEVKSHKEVIKVFEVGEFVKIVDGVFQGFSACISEIDEEKQSMKVLVSIFGRESPVDLIFSQVEKL